MFHERDTTECGTSGVQWSLYSNSLIPQSAQLHLNPLSRSSSFCHFNTSNRDQFVLINTKNIFSSRHFSEMIKCDAGMNVVYCNNKSVFVIRRSDDE